MKCVKGFTLIEFIFVLVIMGVVVTIAVTKFDVFNRSARDSSKNLAIEELNTREKMIWSDIKISEEGYVDDDGLFDRVDYDLGRVKWASGPNTSGGTISTDGGNVSLSRRASTNTEPAFWAD